MTSVKVKWLHFSYRLFSFEYVKNDHQNLQRLRQGINQKKFGIDRELSVAYKNEDNEFVLINSEQVLQSFLESSGAKIKIFSVEHDSNGSLRELTKSVEEKLYSKAESCSTTSKSHTPIDDDNKPLLEPFNNHTSLPTKSPQLIKDETSANEPIREEISVKAEANGPISDESKEEIRARHCSSRSSLASVSLPRSRTASNDSVQSIEPQPTKESNIVPSLDGPADISSNHHLLSGRNLKLIPVISSDQQKRERTSWSQPPILHRESSATPSAKETSEAVKKSIDTPQQRSRANSDTEEIQLIVKEKPVAPFVDLELVPNSDSDSDVVIEEADDYDMDRDFEKDSCLLCNHHRENDEDPCSYYASYSKKTNHVIAHFKELFSDDTHIDETDMRNGLQVCFKVDYKPEDTETKFLTAKKIEEKETAAATFESPINHQEYKEDEQLSKTSIHTEITAPPNLLQVYSTIIVDSAEHSDPLSVENTVLVNQEKQMPVPEFNRPHSIRSETSPRFSLPFECLSFSSADSERKASEPSTEHCNSENISVDSFGLEAESPEDGSFTAKTSIDSSLPNVAISPEISKNYALTELQLTPKLSSKRRLSSVYFENETAEGSKHEFPVSEHLDSTKRHKNTVTKHNENTLNSLNMTVSSNISPVSDLNTFPASSLDCKEKDTPALSTYLSHNCVEQKNSHEEMLENFHPEDPSSTPDNNKQCSNDTESIVAQNEKISVADIFADLKIRYEKMKHHHLQLKQKWAGLFSQNHS